MKHTLTALEKIREFKKRQKQAASKSPKSYDGITPRPWFNLGNTIVGGDANSRYKIAQTMKTVYKPERSVPIKEHEENAAHIIKCVNLHDELVKYIQCNADCKCSRTQGHYTHHLGKEIYVKGEVTKICSRCDLISRAKEAL